MGFDQISTLSFPISAVNFSQQMVISKSSGRETGSPPIHREGTEGGIKRSQSEFVELQKINDNINELAKIQKAFGKRFEKLDRYLEQMKEQLERIIKQFPPFPPGSEDRVKALRAFTFFRKMIDQLTLPPRNEVLMESTKQSRLSPDPDGQEKAIPLQFDNPQTSTNI
jgi:hypothetical protein